MDFDVIKYVMRESMGIKNTCHQDILTQNFDILTVFVVHVQYSHMKFVAYYHDTYMYIFFQISDLIRKPQSGNRAPRMQH